MVIRNPTASVTWLLQKHTSQLRFPFMIALILLLNFSNGSIFFFFDHWWVEKVGFFFNACASLMMKFVLFSSYNNENRFHRCPLPVCACALLELCSLNFHWRPEVISVGTTQAMLKCWNLYAPGTAMPKGGGVLNDSGGGTKLWRTPIMGAQILYFAPW